jgi:hypothetical protein
LFHNAIKLSLSIRIKTQHQGAWVMFAGGGIGAKGGRWAATLVVCLLAAVAAAQEITGDIRGIVTDPSGAVVTGAEVQVINVDRDAVIRVLKTGADGSYVAAYLPVGRYRLTVTASGFVVYNATDIVINVNDRRTVDVKLRVGAATSTIDVTEAPVQVDLQSAAASGLITGTQVRELPLTSRNYLNLVTLQPGVSNTSASDQSFVGVSAPSGLSAQVNLAINGNRPTQNNWTIDQRFVRHCAQHDLCEWHHHWRQGLTVWQRRAEDLENGLRTSLWSGVGSARGRQNFHSQRIWHLLRFAFSGNGGELCSDESAFRDLHLDQQHQPLRSGGRDCGYQSVAGHHRGRWSELEAALHHDVEPGRAAPDHSLNRV